MKVKEVADYLNKFDPEEEVRVVTVDIKKRVQYITEKIILTDLGKPAMIERVIGEEQFSEEEMMVADECERPNVLRESEKDIEWECGCCGERYVEEKNDKSGYCRRCGQFINWEGDKRK